MDLAEIIGVKSIKKELIDFYNVFSRRIAILYHQDKNLKISTCSSEYLARANYELLIDGYSDIMNIAFDNLKKTLKIDLSTLTFIESHVISKAYYWEDDFDIKTVVTDIENNNSKKLVRSLDKM